MADDAAFLSANELLDAYRDKSLSPVEATEAALAQIERLNGQLNAFCLVDREGALAAARESEKRWQAGRPRGRLDGVPLGVKDLLLTEGWPTLRGSRTIDPAGPWHEDAPAVARVKEHGAILLGKTTTPEFGWKGVTDNDLTGITRNPWDPSKTPGGSSGGAAVAAASGMGALHFGTDGGGSIRIPCGFTGIPGLKPTFGRVPAYPLSPFGTVAHVGPMARTVADCALMLTVIAEPDPRDPYALPYDWEDYSDGLEGGVEGLRVAYLPTLNGRPVDPEVAEAVAKAARHFEALGAKVEQPDLDLPDTAEIFAKHWFSGAALMMSGIPEDKQAMIDPGLREVAAKGAAFSLLEYLRAVKGREAFTVRMIDLHQDYDLLLLPTLPLPAFEAGLECPRNAAGERWTDWTPFSYPFNLTGQPAASVPCGLTAAGLPIGLQIVGPRYQDALVLRAARAFERAHPTQRPPLAIG
ncbi:aspartyl-tRNA(Asn)/glutamyl-tRNA(Gln) amidotransferase subunit A [Tistlia consotensis]|uniref:Aspartyl-tRNA(Asn)/glutamyl-tRNA(Gln) amidotransferase subunit A n=1 Tax=Tistlia consotensis USBA 355 TaxID=560819 RepID=A0A1Y6B3K6_9PROT|nr:amidase [Tistlia consotensis]SME89705.1 aspartyl-tRNA(Asn)/glutamyl-tRNA(Gln) amidotransferase subunit A [Tistlia consotensis USBA 355]SNR26223.1 aspartyl-tRNA(Asn)/glutamyl-tRNA(Gln) amidotransferase subunit A [Tistlia consotensis]